MTARSWTALLIGLTLALGAMSAACDDARPTSVETKEPFACGDTTCAGDELCARFGSGVCAGDPVPAGGCRADCQPWECGVDGALVCVCPFYICDALPAGCDDCACALEAEPPPSQCTCAMVDGRPQLSCAGV